MNVREKSAQEKKTYNKPIMKTYGSVGTITSSVSSATTNSDLGMGTKTH